MSKAWNLVNGEILDFAAPRSHLSSTMYVVRCNTVICDVYEYEFVCTVRDKIAKIIACVHYVPCE